jgi:hypothetical protein
MSLSNLVVDVSFPETEMENTMFSLNLFGSEHLVFEFEHPRVFLTHG